MGVSNGLPNDATSLSSVSTGESDIIDVGIFTLSLVAFGLYHAYFLSFVFKLDTRVQMSINIRNGMNWVLKHSIRADTSSITLAVQTLRNKLIVAVLFGGSGLQLGYSYINSYSKIAPLADRVRSVIMIILLFSSFICWTAVIRIASHLSFYIGTLDASQFNESPSYDNIYHDTENGIANEETGLGNNQIS